MTGQGSEAFGQRDGGGSEPITYYNCLASERGAPVRHPSSRRMASLPITSAVIANFSRPCLLLASRSTPPPPQPVASFTLLAIAVVCTAALLAVCINFLRGSNHERADSCPCDAKRKSNNHLRLFPRGFLKSRFGKSAVLSILIRRDTNETSSFALI